MLVAHRGFPSIERGENTLASFRNALKTCLGVEFDLRLTLDGKLIIFHDDNFSRIAKDKRLVRKLTYQQIKTLPFYQIHPHLLPPLFIEEFIPQLAKEYLVINVELKGDYYQSEDLTKFRQGLELLAAKTSAKIIVSSFDHQLLNFITTLDREKFLRGYLFHYGFQIKTKLLPYFDYLHPSLKVALKPRYVKFFKKTQLPLNVWTFNTQSEVMSIKSIYHEQVEGYISNNSTLKIS